MVIMGRCQRPDTGPIPVTRSKVFNSNNKYMADGIRVYNPSEAPNYPERELSPNKINFEPEKVKIISDALLSSGRITKEQCDIIKTFATAGAVDEAMDALHSALEEKKEEK